MTKYIKVDWPDSQRFADNEECYIAIPVDPTNYEISGNTYMVPEDLYNEVMEERMFPAEQDIDLGHLTINKDSITLSTTDETITFVYDYTRIPRNTRILFYSPDKGYWISKSTVTVFGSMPGIYENGEIPGINCEIVGIERNG